MIKFALSIAEIQLRSKIPLTAPLLTDPLYPLYDRLSALGRNQNCNRNHCRHPATPDWHPTTPGNLVEDLGRASDKGEQRKKANKPLLISPASADKSEGGKTDFLQVFSLNFCFSMVGWVRSWIWRLIFRFLDTIHRFRNKNDL